MCDKIQHETYDSARRHQTGLLKRKGTSAKVYRCPECGCLHIATNRYYKRKKK